MRDNSKLIAALRESNTPAAKAAVEKLIKWQNIPKPDFLDIFGPNFHWKNYNEERKKEYVSIGSSQSYVTLEWEDMGRWYGKPFQLYWEAYHRQRGDRMPIRLESDNLKDALSEAIKMFKNPTEPTIETAPRRVLNPRYPQLVEETRVKNNILTIYVDGPENKTRHKAIYKHKKILQAVPRVLHLLEELQDAYEEWEKP